MREFRIFFFKVGNGHCSYVEFPNGKNGLIDVKVNHEQGYDNIIEILNKANIKKIDYLWITHPHQDHIGGLYDLKNNFKIGTFICSTVFFRPDPIYNDWKVYEEMKRGYYCENRDEVTEGYCTKIGDCKIDYLAPTKYLLENQPDNVNNNGLVLRFNCRRHRIIIPGDIEEDGWEYIKDTDIADTTLLLASHHGNNSGYNLAKINEMNLAFAIISTGTKTEHNAEQKYKKQVSKNVYTTKAGRILARIDWENTLYIE